MHFKIFASIRLQKWRRLIARFTYPIRVIQNPRMNLWISNNLFGSHVFFLGLFEPRGLFECFFIFVDKLISKLMFSFSKELSSTKLIKKTLLLSVFLKTNFIFVVLSFCFLVSQSVNLFFRAFVKLPLQKILTTGELGLVQFNSALYFVCL